MSKCDLIGYEVTDLVHTADVGMLKQLLALGVGSTSVSILDPEIHFTLRFDGALANKRRAGIYIDGFKVFVHFCSYISQSSYAPSQYISLGEWPRAIIADLSDTAIQ